MESETVVTVDPAPIRYGYIEILSRSGRVRYRVPLESLLRPLQLGRGLGNDVILDDPYVCPVHAQLSVVDGMLHVVDLGSINGLSRGAGQPLQPVLVLGSGECVRIGHTMVRYRTLDAPVAPTVRDHAVISPLQRYERLGLVAGLVLASFALQLGQTWYGTVEETDGIKVLLDPLAGAAVLALWSGGWAFVSRLLLQRWNFWSHIGIACSALLGFFAGTALLEYFCFAFNLDAWQAEMLQLLAIVGTGLLLYAHLRFTSAAAPRRLARIVAAFGVATLVLLTLVEQGEKDEFRASPAYQPTLKSPGFRFVRARSADEFFAGTAALTRQLQEASTVAQQEGASVRP